MTLFGYFTILGLLTAWRLSSNKHGILVRPRITIGLDVEIPMEVATFGDISRVLGTPSRFRLELQNVD